MAEKLVNTEISEYIEVLSSEAPAPGGGAVAALTAAQGAALIMMVANLTIGKKKYAEYEELNIGARDEARTYLEQLMKGVDEDKEAFEQVSKAYSMAKQTDSEKAARREAIAIASVGAADAPLKLMRAGVCGRYDWQIKCEFGQRSVCGSPESQCRSAGRKLQRGSQHPVYS